MKTATETRERLDEIRDSGSLFGSFGADAILDVLPYEQAQPFLEEGVSAEEWKAATWPFTEEGVKAAMRDYMGFAWSKVTGHRGISANRSVARFVEWLWILEDAETLEFAEDEGNYPQYGAPVLMRVCEAYGFDVPEEGTWNGNAARRMAQGEPCRPDCDEGCSW